MVVQPLMAAAGGPPVGDGPAGILIRRPTPADHRPFSDVADEWWGGRRIRWLLPRFWFEHLAGRSLVAATAEGRRIGLLLGFASQDRPGEAYLHLVGVDPNHRRRGIGRLLVERFADDVAAAGVSSVVAVAWPANRAAVRFYEALGFRLDTGPGTRPIHGIPAYQDYDAEGEDRARFVLDLTGTEAPRAV